MKTLSSLPPSLILATLLVGCSATGPLFVRAAPPTGSDHAVIDIYRPDSFLAGGIEYRVLVDGRTLASLANNGHTRVTVPPGHHVVDVGFWVWWGLVPLIPCFSGDAPRDLDAGEQAFVKVDPGVFSAFPREMQETQALRELATSRFVEPYFERME